jgi:hypothetical protein
MPDGKKDIWRQNPGSLEPFTPHVIRSSREHLKGAALPFRWGTPVPQTPFFRGNILVLLQKTSSAKSRTAVFTEHIQPKVKEQTPGGKFQAQA